MDNTLLVTVSAQNALRRQMEVAANNMANVNTTGFKAEAVLFEPFERRPAQTRERPRDIAFVRDASIARDFRPGSLQQTGNPFDLALTGPGFFTVQTAEGPAYTRDGRFQPDATGNLVTRDGRNALDAAGQPLRIDPAGGDVRIDSQGRVTQNGREVGALAIVTFARPGALERIGDNLARAGDQAPEPAVAPGIVQGALEGSNVVAITELTRMLDIARAYDSASRLQRQAEDLRGRALDRLARMPNG